MGTIVDGRGHLPVHDFLVPAEKYWTARHIELTRKQAFLTKKSNRATEATGPLSTERKHIQF